jgi:hypothetical protein
VAEEIGLESITVGVAVSVGWLEWKDESYYV